MVKKERKRERERERNIFRKQEISLSVKKWYLVLQTSGTWYFRQVVLGTSDKWYLVLRVLGCTEKFLHAFVGERGECATPL